jgi:hypothetical protein
VYGFGRNAEAGGVAWEPYPGGCMRGDWSGGPRGDVGLFPFLIGGRVVLG